MLAGALALLLAGCQPEAAGQTEASSGLPRGEGYEFLVLSLSWSPSYCEAEGADANQQQCRAGNDHAFVVHGLWPQFERGWPEFCDSSEPGRVPDALVRDVIDLIPSAGLIGHQWRKHGSCAGMSQRDYFALTRAARERIEAAFIDANPGLHADGIAVTCQDGFLREVRICLGKELDFRSCPEVDARGCRQSSSMMPAPG